ncbi:pilus assembly PilX family protein [Curtobacterium aurantiacum]|uniref:Flp pilus-assembly TadG-like N-terminal domain-containing protein n=2 Tax=Curtobacterium aurantiacum TaxID=3236919 RepID=A0ABS5VA32_9MICO|nr:hypothetical protein [Curtobacterium flaccumfaciens]MBT1543967.1 hypothetical protein [Curtobacterium flaccumfaciens pv. flaccumfaciens]MBT1586334.1 hypothetical protein [Curtobacterium flaccumfaciens pv. flaccumfaciens]MBT1679132.1 hypothetical protein [Curtobacterium flaccumfaciens pv. flaccumfaciens]
MLIRLVRALRRRDDERGVALAAVIGLGAVLMIVLSLVVATATSGATKASNDDDYNKAMAAAYAGLSDYQGRLAADNAYVKYGVRTPFSGDSTYSADTANKAFGVSVGGSWAPVVGSTDQFYRYEVDNSAYANTGKVRLRVTGKANGATRTLVVDLRGDGFVNYLWFTNYESQDPSLTGETTTTTSGGSTTTRCTSAHRNEKNWNSSTSCRAVLFASGDRLDGPVRTNDVITACGATFNQAVSHTGPAGFFYTSKEPTIDSSCRTSTKFSGGPIGNKGTLPMPSTNANMKQEARTDISDKVAKPGCIYTGPTSITFLAGGKMRVVSPWTVKTQLSGAANGAITGGSTNDALCGSVPALRGAGAVIPTLPSNLVYVQTVPGASGDPNYWPPNTTPTGTVNGTVNAGSPVYCQQTVKAATGRTTSDYGNGLGYPKSNEFTGALGDSGYYGCRNGDVFVSGSFGGQMTLAAENFVYVTGSIVYQNGRNSDDMLGLVGQRAVSVSNPISCSSGTSSTCSTASGESTNLAPTQNIEVDAAIASNLGTFNVQNSAFGSNLGTLTIYGSIAQQFRGSVRTSYNDGSWVTGYAKAYAYDTRLKSSAPPKFLQPVSTTYGVTTETESATAFRADGTPTGK